MAEVEADLYRAPVGFSRHSAAAHKGMLVWLANHSRAHSREFTSSVAVHRMPMNLWSTNTTRLTKLCNSQCFDRANVGDFRGCKGQQVRPPDQHLDQQSSSLN